MRPKRLVFAILAALTGVMMAFFILICGEVAVRVFKLHPLRPTHHIRVAASVSENHSTSPLQVPIHLPPKRPGPYRAEWPQKGLLPAVYSRQFWQRDPQMGNVPRAMMHGHVVQKYKSGRVAYSITYATDSERRRITPGQGDGPRSRALLFLGDSFTAGEGLDQDQTIAAQAARLQNRYRVYNYGVPGWGTANVLRQVSQAGFAHDVPKGGHDIAVYLFIDHHFNRVLASLDTYRIPGFHWSADLPYYYLDSSNRLISDGLWATARPWRDGFFQILGKSELLKFFQVNIPMRLTDYDFRLFATIVKGIQTTLDRKLNGVDFYVAFYPCHLAHALIPYLDREGIKSLDYSSLWLPQYIEPPTIMPDGHPSPHTAAFFAHQILSDLGILREKPLASVGRGS